MLVSLLTFGIIATSCAQGNMTAPSGVQTAFKAKFAAAQKVKWDMEDENEWEAEFKMNGKEMSANFSSDGTWLETEAEIKTSALPQAVKSAIAAQFAGYEMEEATTVESPGKPMAYEVELEKGETTIEAVFGADGTLIKQKTESEEDDKD